MADSIVILDGALGANFAPSRWFLLHGEKDTLDFKIVVSSGPAVVAWYLEFSKDLVDAYREVAEEDVGNGVTHMPKVLRDFKEASTGTGLLTGTHLLTTQFVRSHMFCRIQIACTSGTVTRATVLSRFGELPTMP